METTVAHVDKLAFGWSPRRAAATGNPCGRMAADNQWRASRTPRRSRSTAFRNDEDHGVVATVSIAFASSADVETLAIAAFMNQLRMNGNTSVNPAAWRRHRAAQRAFLQATATE